MIYYATETGGRAFYNTNDLKDAIRKALEDCELTYTLGYYPDHGQWEGRYRTIKVLVNRKDVEVATVEATSPWPARRSGAARAAWNCSKRLLQHLSTPPPWA
jgi:hypothetical protein